MKWSDIPKNPTNRMLRQFAAAWLVFFLGWALWQALRHGRTGLGIGLGALALVVGGAGLARPALLRWIFVGWMMLAFPIGWLLSQVMLILLFYGIFLPVALIMRLRGRDALGLKPGAGQPTFWLPKQTPLDVRSYFRQY